MFLQLAHTKLDAFGVSRELVLRCYQLTRGFPKEERFALVQQIRRAATSVHLNLAEGCSRRSAVERRRFFEIARGSLIEVDTAFDLAYDLSYVARDELGPVGGVIIKTFKILTGMMK